MEGCDWPLRGPGGDALRLKGSRETTEPSTHWQRAVQDKPETRDAKLTALCTRQTRQHSKHRSGVSASIAFQQVSVCFGDLRGIRVNTQRKDATMAERTFSERASPSGKKRHIVVAASNHLFASSNRDALQRAL